MEYIKLKDSNLTGILISKNKAIATVKINNKKLKTNINNIIYIPKENINNLYNKTNNNKIYTLTNPSINFNNEIMLRHKTKDEAIYMLEIFINEAYNYNVDKIRIVHGKQGGILRQAVHEYLNKCKYIESFKLGNYFEGQFGVTIAYIKKS